MINVIYISIAEDICLFRSGSSDCITPPLIFAYFQYTARNRVRDTRGTRKLKFERKEEEKKKKRENESVKQLGILFGA